MFNETYIYENRIFLYIHIYESMWIFNVEKFLENLLHKHLNIFSQQRSDQGHQYLLHTQVFTIIYFPSG